MMKKHIQSAIYLFAAAILMFLASNNSFAQGTIVAPAAGNVIKSTNAVIQLQNLPTTTSWSVIWSSNGGKNWQSTNVSYAYSGIGSGPASETVRWQVNFNGSVDSDCYVAFIQANASSGFDTIERDGPFTLWSNQGIRFTVNYPDSANSTIHQDSTLTIKFSVLNPTAYAPDSINLYVKYTQSPLPPNFKASDTLLKNYDASFVRGGGVDSVKWIVPKTPTTGVKVFVTTTDHGGNGSSVALTIQGASLSILSPKGGDSVIVGQPDTILWSLSDSVSNDTVTINYSPDGQSFTSIAKKVPSWQGYYIWTPAAGTFIPSSNAEIVITADGGFVNQKSNSFWLGVVNNTGVSENGTVPSIYLDQNYPNPFSATADNSVTNIPFSLSSPQNVSLRVFDVLGREVYHSPMQLFSAGAHTVQFSALQLQQGAYWYDLLAGTHSLTGARRMMLYVK